MYKIGYSKESRQDLTEIYSFIAADNPFYADRVIETILGFINGMLSTFPKIGKEIGIKNLREIIEPTFRYRIIYVINDDEILVVSMLKYRDFK